MKAMSVWMIPWRNTFRNRQLIMIFLVQHAGWPGDGVKILPAFQAAAAEAFGH